MEETTPSDRGVDPPPLLVPPPGRRGSASTSHDYTCVLQVNGDRDVQVVAAYVGEGELMGCATSYFYGSLKYELFAALPWIRHRRRLLLPGRLFLPLLRRICCWRWSICGFPPSLQRNGGKHSLEL
ncbi:hypothetical protein ACQJBY_048687 [Aegilops geniculata]